MPSAAIVTPSRSSLTGIVPSHAWRLVVPRYLQRLELVTRKSIFRLRIPLHFVPISCISRPVFIDLDELTANRRLMSVFTARARDFAVVYFVPLAVENYLRLENS